MAAKGELDGAYCIVADGSEVADAVRKSADIAVPSTAGVLALLAALVGESA